MDTFGPAQPRGVTRNGAGAWLMRSQPRQENVSRTWWKTFQVRGVVSRLSMVSSLSLDSRPEIGRCRCAMRHWVVLSAR